MKKLVVGLLFVGQSCMGVQTEVSNELKTAAVFGITALGGYALANKVARYPLGDKALFGTTAVGVFSGLGMALGAAYGDPRLFCTSSTLAVITTTVLDKRSQKEKNEKQRERVQDLFLVTLLYQGVGLAAATGAYAGREQAFLSAMR